MQHAMQDAQDADWLTLSEAAAQLGVSTDTVRRRISAACWTPGMSQGNAAPSCGIRLGTPGNLLGDGATPGVMPGNAMPELVTLLRDTQAELLRKAEAAAMWQARAELLASQLEQAQRALAAPREPLPEAPEHSAVGPAGGTTQQPAERQRPWWRFW